MSKVLVTGVTGQDGSYMSDFLLEKGHTVYGAVRRVSNRDDRNIKHLFNNDSFALVEMDITDFASVSSVVKQLQPDYLINFAANSFVGNSWGMPINHFNTNALGVLHCLEAIRLHVPLCRFYSAGSSEEFGNVEYSPQDERHPLKPRSPYGASKVSARMLTKVYRESHHMYAVQGWLFNHECLSSNTPVILRDEKDIVQVEYIRNLMPERTDNSKDVPFLQKEFQHLEIWNGEAFCKLKAITRKKASLLEKENQKICYMNSRHGAIAVTPNHKFYNQENQKQELRNFKTGDKLQHLSFPEVYRQTSVTEEFASLLGYLVGDGYVSESSIRFINQDKELRDDFLFNLEKSIGAFKANESPNPSGFGGVGSIKLDISGVDTNYVRYIRNLIYDKKTGHKKVPNIILNADEYAKRSFFNSYYKCDGLKAGNSKYEYSSFKTNSALLAQGLLVLCDDILDQEFCINVFEQNEKVYYQINLNSTDPNRKGNHLSKPKDTLVKTFNKDLSGEFVYDVETESGFLNAGVGLLKVGNSARRGEEFVTQKVAKGVGYIYNHLQSNNFDFPPISLGNIYSQRDWSHALDFMDGIWRMLNQEDYRTFRTLKPTTSIEDHYKYNLIPQLREYVLSSGETHTIKEFVEKAFEAASIKGVWIGEGLNEKFLLSDDGVLPTKKELVLVDINENFYRPAEVDLLLGSSEKITRTLGWKPNISFGQLVDDMVKAQINYPNT